MLASIGGTVARFVFGHDTVKGLVPLFDLNQERNLPTFFSMLLLLFAAVLLGSIAALNARQRMPHVSRWALLACGFLFMAYDEAFQVHESLIAPVQGLLGDGDLGIFYFSWVIPGIATAVLAGLFFTRFLLHLPAATRVRFLVSAALYLGGAIGIELIGGRHVELLGEQNLTYAVITTVEESLEIAGLVVFIWALLKYVADQHPEVRIRFVA